MTTLLAVLFRLLAVLAGHLYPEHRHPDGTSRSGARTTTIPAPRRESGAAS